MKEIIRNKTSIFISDSVFELFESYKQFGLTDNESGGILLGQIIEKGIYILRASTPNKFDKSSRYSFECNKDAAQVIINYEFLNSNKKTIYIGEWHTHPEKNPTPSGIDKSMIIGQFKKNKLNEPFLILIIQGLNGFYIALWDGIKLHDK
jgi:integrative and conjugative element protein (TIGR02256 family)